MSQNVPMDTLAKLCEERKLKPINKRVLLKGVFVGDGSSFDTSTVKRIAANALFHEVIAVASDVPEHLGLFPERRCLHINAAADGVEGDESEYILVHCDDIIAIW